MTERAAERTASPVVVTVVRTGGFAGLRREWRAEPDEEDVPHWFALIDDCPWDDAGPFPPSGADRFVWRVRAVCDTERGRSERDAELPDERVRGAWRTLIDEVRSGG